MHIGELAERAGLSLRTLRHYDEVGLLRPSGRSGGGFRIYSEQDHDRLLLIRQVRALGFSLEDIAELLDALDTTSDAAGANRSSTIWLQDFLEEARNRREAMAATLGRADEFIAAMDARLAA